jgi:hypothetical protein
LSRGKVLQDNMRDLVRRFVNDRHIITIEDIKQWGWDPTAKQRKWIQDRVDRKKSPMPFEEALVNKWRKLEDRVQRGVGNPCPLLLVGLPDTIVTFHEGSKALAEIREADERVDAEEEQEAERG